MEKEEVVAMVKVLTVMTRALDLAPWQTSEQKEIFEDNLIGSFVSSISVPAGSQKGKVVFDNADIIPGRYFYVYRLNAEFSNDGRGLIIARSSLCLLRVSLPVEKHRISVRVFHIYIAANAGPEMEKERTVAGRGDEFMRTGKIGRSNKRAGDG
eukprot:758784-Hanusia_phi.AAC.3